MFLLLSIVSQGCRNDDGTRDDGSSTVLERGDSAARTVLVYIMAENNLSDMVDSDLKEMRRGIYSMPDSCYLLAFVDDTDKPYLCRFYKSKAGAAVCDTVLKFKEDFYSTDTVKFKEVLSWVLQEYPSDNFGLVMWSHGSGWLYDKSKTRSIGVDNGENSYNNFLSTSRWMDIDELADVLKSIPAKTDFVLFDACFMQCVEVAYAMRDAVDWLIGSPAEIPGYGAPYDRIMSSLFSFPFDAGGLIKRYKEGCDAIGLGVLLSAIDCSALDRLAEVTAMFVPAYFSADSIVSDSRVMSYLPGGSFPNLDRYPYAVTYPEFCDMNGQMKLRFPEEAYRLWKEVFDDAVPYKVASSSWWSDINGEYCSVQESQYGGVSMYVPRSKSRYSSLNADFRRTAWYGATGWESAGW